jgi:hypothetical protein
MGLACGLVFILAVTSAGPVHAQTSPAAPTATMYVVEYVQPHYDLYGSGTNTVDVVLNGTAFSVPNDAFTIASAVSLHTANVTGVGENVALVGTSLSQGEYTYSFQVFTNASSFYIGLTGYVSSATFLWRSISAGPGGLVQTQTLTSFVYVVTTPSGNVLSQVYTAKGANLPLSSAYLISSNSTQLSYSGYSAGLLVFQASSFLPTSIAISVAALAVLALAALNLFAPGKQVFDEVTNQLRVGAATLLRAVPSFSVARKGFRIRTLFQPRKLLTLFILCSLLMVALGAFGGPDPRVKAFVMAGTPAQTDAIKTQLQAVAGSNALIITPDDDFTDFNVMSSVGQFNIVVISNATPTQIQEWGQFVFGYLGNVPIVMVDSSANTNVSESVSTLYPDQYFGVGNAGQLTPTESAELGTLLAANQRTNVLGLSLSVRDFKVLLGVEAVLSMVLVLLGWAYLGALTSESRSMSDISHLVTLIAAGAFVFFFSEGIYVVTSLTLAVPVSLHAVNSDAHDITAIGLLGFGGGSTPRLAAGFLGVLVGALGVEGGPRVSKRDLVLLGGLALFLLANPLFIGQYVYQGILLFFPLGSLAFGTAFSNSLVVKGFIYGFGEAFGGSVTATYILSAGKTLFFAGLIPLAYLRRMGRTTTAVVLLVVALMIGDGGVRVGEMTPEKTVVAVVPGLVAGFAFTALFIGLAAIEKYVRGNWKSRV